MTLYVELRAILHQLIPQPGQTVVDLGAAYGRLGFIIGRHYRGVRFVGYEYAGERLEEGRRCLTRFVSKEHSRDFRLIHADLASKSLHLEEADIYFIYDFGALNVIEKILFDLRRLSNSRTITVVGRGRHCRYLIIIDVDRRLKAHADCYAILRYGPCFR